MHWLVICNRLENEIMNRKTSKIVAIVRQRIKRFDHNEQCMEDNIADRGMTVEVY